MEQPLEDVRLAENQRTRLTPLAQISTAECYRMNLSWEQSRDKLAASELASARHVLGYVAVASLMPSSLFSPCPSVGTVANY
jgi:hypothetical protein